MGGFEKNTKYKLVTCVVARNIIQQNWHCHLDFAKEDLMAEVASFPYGIHDAHSVHSI